MMYPHPDDMKPPECDPVMPLHAPEWMWAEWERRELEWAQFEHTWQQLDALPETDQDTGDNYWTREQIDRERDFEAAGWDNDDEGEDE